MNSLHVTSNREKIAMRISWYSIAVNVFLSLGKFVAGIFGHSAAMVSDAIHSASDVFGLGCFRNIYCHGRHQDFRKSVGRRPSVWP